MLRTTEKTTGSISPDPTSDSSRVALLSGTDLAPTDEENKMVPGLWKSSATIPELPDLERGTTKEGKMSPSFDVPSSPTSPTLSSSSESADVPLLSDTEEITVEEDEKTPEAPEEEKKSFSKAEYKIALSHFVVRN
jgi:hypothetical protein